MVFKLIIGLATVFSCVAFAKSSQEYRFTPPSSWLTKPVSGLEEYWVDPKDKTTSLAILKDNSQKDYELPEDLKDFTKKMVDMRKFSMKLFGINNYSVTSSNLEKTVSGFQITIKGSYNSFDGRKVFFKEVQYYIGKRYFQVTVTSSKSGKSQLSEMTNSLLRGFKVL